MRQVNPEIERYFLWLETSKPARVPRTQRAFAQMIGVAERTLMLWKNRYEEEKSTRPPIDEVAQFMEHLRMEALKLGAPAAVMELYAKAKGLITSKAEITHKLELTASDHYRIDREADRRIREFGREPDGIQSVQEESPLLLGEVCVDSEQEHSSDS